MKNVTLVIGASLNDKRYSNIVIGRLVDRQLKITAIGAIKGTVFGVEIDTG